MNKFKLSFSLMALIFLAGCADTSSNSNKANEDLAMAWVEAGYTGKAEAIAMVTNNMAEDGEAVSYTHLRAHET